MNSIDAGRARIAADVWLTVCDELLWGFNHSLSNRVAAITSISRILDHSDTGLDPLLSALTGEIDTLERMLSLLRLIPRDRDGSPEPVLVEDLLPDVLRLHELRGGACGFDVQKSGDPQPVWMARASLIHALVLALGAAGRAARDGSVGGIRVDSSEEKVMVEIASSVAAAHGAPVGSSALSEGERTLLGVLIGDAGGEVAEGKGEATGRWELRLGLPTLIAVRSRERDADGQDADARPAGSVLPGPTTSSSF